MKIGLKTFAREKWTAFLVTKRRFLIIELTPSEWIRFLFCGRHDAAILRLFILSAIAFIIALLIP